MQIRQQGTTVLFIQFVGVHRHSLHKIGYGLVSKDKPQKTSS